GAGGVLAALLAEDGNEGRAFAGIVFAVIHLEHSDPGDALALVNAGVRRRHIVLHGAGHHAGAASVAAIDVDRHAVFFGIHMRTTFAPVEARSWLPAISTTPGRILESTVTRTSRLP